MRIFLSKRANNLPILTTTKNHLEKKMQIFLPNFPMIFVSVCLLQEILDVCDVKMYTFTIVVHVSHDTFLVLTSLLKGLFVFYPRTKENGREIIIFVGSFDNPSFQSGVWIKNESIGP